MASRGRQITEPSMSGSGMLQDVEDRPRAIIKPKSCHMMEGKSPAHWSKSKGEDERAAQTAHGLARTLKDDFNHKPGSFIESYSPTLTWLVEHTLLAGVEEFLMRLDFGAW